MGSVHGALNGRSMGSALSMGSVHVFLILPHPNEIHRFLRSPVSLHEFPCGLRPFDSAQDLKRARSSRGAASIPLGRQWGYSVNLSIVKKDGGLRSNFCCAPGSRLYQSNVYGAISASTPSRFCLPKKNPDPSSQKLVGRLPRPDKRSNSGELRSRG
jgi:hypothetical protein